MANAHDDEFGPPPLPEIPKVQVAGYVDTFAGAPDGAVVPRAELEAAVARTPRVPLKLGDKIIGYADLSVDDHGLGFKSTIEDGQLTHIIRTDGDANLSVVSDGNEISIWPIPAIPTSSCDWTEPKDTP